MLHHVSNIDETFTYWIMKALNFTLKLGSQLCDMIIYKPYH